MLVVAQRRRGRQGAQGPAEGGDELQLGARTRAGLERAADELCDGPGVDVAVHALDLRDSAVIPGLLGATGAVDIMVNNAGAIPGGDLDAVDEAVWRTDWALKVYGYINMTRVYAQIMRARLGRHLHHHRASLLQDGRHL